LTRDFHREVTRVVGSYVRSDLGLVKGWTFSFLVLCWAADALNRKLSFPVSRIMAGQGRKARVNLPRLASADLVDRSLHIIKNPTARNAAQNPERLRQRIEQHLMGLQRITLSNAMSITPVPLPAHSKERVKTWVKSQ
jgi:ABC-type transport system involved in cytochrome c biogenesis ATPase subunit